jgi:CHASE3 domain sensor protein
MDTELVKKLEAQDEKLERIYQSVEKTRKYFLWTMIATVVTFVLPLIGLIFAVPFFLSTLSTAYGL